MKISFARYSGFTLLELLIVIAIISIIGALITVRWPTNNISLSAQTQQVANTIRYVQSLAMSRAQDYRIVFTSSSNIYSYSIIDASGNTVNDPITNNSSTTLGNGTQLSFSANLNNNLISFDSLGIPYSNANTTTALSANGTITFTSPDGLTRTITITQQTGKVAIS